MADTARGAAGVSGGILLLWVWGVFRELLSFIADLGSAVPAAVTLQPIVAALWFKLSASVIGVALVGYWARGSKRGILSRAELSKAAHVWRESFPAATSALVQAIEGHIAAGLRPELLKRWPSPEALTEFLRTFGQRARLHSDVVRHCEQNWFVQSDIDWSRKELLESYRRQVELVTWADFFRTMSIHDLSTAYVTANLRKTMHTLEPELQAVLVGENLSNISVAVRTTAEKTIQKVMLPNPITLSR